MRLRIKLIIHLFLFGTSSLFAQQADVIIGKYHLPNKLDVQIFKNKDKYYGKIIALNGYENGQTKDINNFDKSKQKEPLIGKLIIRDLEYDEGKKEWINGSIYGSEKGLIFSFKITKVRGKEIEVVASKYFFRRTLKWGRI
jgi:hypothetical protein